MFYIIWRVAGSALLLLLSGVRLLPPKLSVSLSPQLRISLLLHSQFCSRMLLLKRHPIHWTKFAFFCFFWEQISALLRPEKSSEAVLPGFPSWALPCSASLITVHWVWSLRSPHVCFSRSGCTLGMLGGWLVCVNVWGRDTAWHCVTHHDTARAPAQTQITGRLSSGRQQSPLSRPRPAPL